jgi:predicted nucleic acid-binding protein
LTVAGTSRPRPSAGRSSSELPARHQRREKIENPIGAYDLLIAGQALRRGLTVVTANTAEFGRVTGLSWQDWSN